MATFTLEVHKQLSPNSHSQTTASELEVCEVNAPNAKHTDATPVQLSSVYVL